MDGLRERDNQELRMVNAEKRKKGRSLQAETVEVLQKKIKLYSTARETTEYFAIKRMLYRKIDYADTVICPKSRENIQSENNTKRLQPTTHRYMPQKTIRRKCALLVARPLRAPNRRVRTEAKL